MDKGGFGEESLEAIESGRLEARISQLKSSSYTLFYLAGIENGEDFFAQAIANLPLDPPLSGRVNWDAFCDSLWEGLDAVDGEKIAIVWHGAHVMEQGDGKNYRICIECLQDICRSLKSRSNGAGRKEVKVLLVD